MLRSISRTSNRSLSRSVLSRRSYSTEIDPQGPSFGLSEDQAAFQQLARDFTAKEITPVAAEYDRSMKVRYNSLITARAEYRWPFSLTRPSPTELSPALQFPWPIVKSAHAAGLMNLHIPETVRCFCSPTGAVRPAT